MAAKQGADRGEPDVEGANAVASIVSPMVEERTDEGGVKIADGQLRGFGAPALGRAGYRGKPPRYEAWR